VWPAAGRARAAESRAARRRRAPVCFALATTFGHLYRTRPLSQCQSAVTFFVQTKTAHTAETEQRAPRTPRRSGGGRPRGVPTPVSSVSARAARRAPPPARGEFRGGRHPRPARLVWALASARARASQDPKSGVEHSGNKPTGGSPMLRVIDTDARTGAEARGRPGSNLPDVFT
jgi:hypothetical protein